MPICHQLALTAATIPFSACCSEASPTASTPSQDRTSESSILGIIEMYLDQAFAPVEHVSGVAKQAYIASTVGDMLSLGA